MQATGTLISLIRTQYPAVPYVLQLYFLSEQSPRIPESQVVSSPQEIALIRFSDGSNESKPEGSLLGS